MVHLQRLTIEIPNVEQMSDEELGGLARENDGRWSDQTKALMAQFRTSKLDLNGPWAKTWTGWICPCCQRTKRQIARLSRDGVLRCKLESHHDHLSDYAKRYFDDLNPSVRNEGDHNIQRSIARGAIAALTMRFDRSLVCSDCNSAEAEAKKNISSVEKNFTFTPGEIAKFVEATDNTRHEIDLISARQLWEAARDDFADRIEFAERMAKRFSKGKNTQEIVRQPPDRSFHDGDYFWAKVKEAYPALTERTLSDQIEKRSVASDGDGEFSIGRPRQSGRAPTDDEFRLIEQRLPAGKEYWFGLGETWKCECCQRSKREICRVSNKHLWTARIHKLRDWEFELDAVNLQWRSLSTRNVQYIRQHRTVYICQDCRGVVTALRRLHPEVHMNAITPRDLSEVIIEVRTNGEHLVDYQRALERAKGNAGLVLAVDDYDRHLRTSNDASHAFTRQTGYAKMSADMALSAIGDGLEVDRRMAVEYARWLVSEGSRFKELLKSEKSFGGNST